MARYNGRIIVGVGGKQIQANWNETDSNSPAYIQNKPDISGALTRQVVNTLPTEDIDPNCIYMIPKSDPDTGDYYDEYMYISNNWEQIGSTQMTQVQSDWAETDSTAVDYIANKPNNLDLVVPFTQNGTAISTTVSASDIMSAITAGQGVYATLNGMYLPLNVFQNTAPEKIIFSGMIEGLETIITGKEVSNVWTWTLTENDLNASSDWFGTQQEFDALGTYDENINYHIEQELATVAFTGDYDDLSNKPAAPSIPSNLVTGVNVSGVDTALTLRVITQSDYDALVQGGTVDANTVYMIS